MELNGLYLVVNPKQNRVELLSKLKEALNAGVSAVQLYNGWPKNFSYNNKVELCSEINNLCKEFNTPFFINNEWELLKDLDLAGVHFDKLPENWVKTKKAIGRSILTGLTMTNDLSILKNLESLEIDYLSFCAMFPSASVGNCEIVNPKNVEKTLQEVNIPVFISGGVTPEKINQFKYTPISGVAVISGVMNADNPKKAVQEYKNELTKIIK